MPQSEIQSNCVAIQPPKSLNGILPGTTFLKAPLDTDYEARNETSSTPTSAPGLRIHDCSTTLTLFTPSQLAASPLLKPLSTVINAAFATQGHQINGESVLSAARLRYDGQLIDELGAGTGTFTYVLHSRDEDGKETVIATASAKRYLGKVEIAGMQDFQQTGNTFTRFGPVAEGREMWELSTMAVDGRFQRQGLAGYLMKITEAEVVRRFRGGNVKGKGRKLIMAITTIKEVNEIFYRKRGFETDYEVVFPVGHMESVTGFTITHMSKEVAVDEEPVTK